MRAALPILALFIANALSHAADATFWQSDYEHAIAEAIQSEKCVLLYFTGSDWCHWCQKLDNELFSPSAARTQLTEKLVPILLDFPQRRRESPGKVRRNRQLKHAWTITAFPTVIVFDPTSGVELWRHSYLAVSAQDYLHAIDLLLQQ